MLVQVYEHIKFTLKSFNQFCEICRICHTVVTLSTSSYLTELSLCQQILSLSSKMAVSEERRVRRAWSMDLGFLLQAFQRITMVTKLKMYRKIGYMIEMYVTLFYKYGRSYIVKIVENVVQRFWLVLFLQLSQWFGG